MNLLSGLRLYGTVSDFDVFFAAEYEPVVRSLTLAFGDRDAAEDAAQGGFEKALRHWTQVGQMDRPGTWVYVVAVRSGRRALSRQTQEQQAVGDSPVPSPEAATVNAAWVGDALARLAPRQRAVVVLRHHGGLSLKDIAEALGISVGTVKSTLHAAHRRLNIELSSQTTEEEEASHATRRT
jgi:RNA polymerase sigma factor (sigma-70 family)